MGAKKLLLITKDGTIFAINKVLLLLLDYNSMGEITIWVYANKIND